MLKKLRWKLTFYYFVIALCLIALMGGGSYWLLSQYFQQTIDMALQYRMAQELGRYGVSLAPEMVSATTLWCEMNQLPTPIVHVDVEDDAIQIHSEEDEEFDDEAYNADLAAIFVFPLDDEGVLLFDPNIVSPRVSPNIEAVQSAIQEGCDWRTVILADGRILRLFTYELPPTTAPQVLQLGRFMESSNRVLKTLMMGIFGLGGFSTLALGLGAWVLAGRSLKPAQQAFDQQQVFIANASHELRAPLTIMRATTEVAMRRAEGDRQKQLLQNLVDENDHMSSLVEDLLLLSRLDAGKLAIDMEDIPVAALFDPLRQQVKVLTEKEGITLVLSGNASIIHGDKTRLRQVLLILLVNAIQHTPKGGTIRLVVKDDKKNVQIVVEDNGEGISTEHLPHVFERFYQADSSMGQEHKGAGLGLSIARSLVEAHNGRISVESTLDQGTLVTITLPRVI